jgi:hypothetical protein
MDCERLKRTRRWKALFGFEEATSPAMSVPGEGHLLVLSGEATGGKSRLIAGEEGGLACPDATGRA